MTYVHGTDLRTHAATRHWHAISIRGNNVCRTLCDIAVEPLMIHSGEPDEDELCAACLEEDAQGDGAREDWGLTCEYDAECSGASGTSTSAVPAATSTSTTNLSSRAIAGSRGGTDGSCGYPCKSYRDCASGGRTHARVTAARNGCASPTSRAAPRSANGTGFRFEIGA